MPSNIKKIYPVHEVAAADGNGVFRVLVIDGASNLTSADIQALMNEFLRLEGLIAELQARVEKLEKGREQ